MDNPPSTTNPTPLRRRVLFTGAAALAAAGCVGIATVASASGDPLVPSADYVRNQMPLVHTQTAAQPVLFHADPDITLDDLQQVAVTVPLAGAAAGAVVAPVSTGLASRRIPAPTTTTAPPAPRPAPTPAPVVTPVAAVHKGADPGDPAVWDRLAQCESGGNWATNTGNGYYGGLQFSASSWRGVGGTGLPHQASRETQIEMGQRLQARAGWSQWPACTRKLGYR